MPIVWVLSVFKTNNLTSGNPLQTIKDFSWDRILFHDYLYDYIVLVLLYVRFFIIIIALLALTYHNSRWNGQ